MPRRKRVEADQVPDISTSDHEMPDTSPPADEFPPAQFEHPLADDPVPSTEPIEDDAEVSANPPKPVKPHKFVMAGELLATAFGSTVPDRFSLIRIDKDGVQKTDDITTVFYEEGRYDLDEIERVQRESGGQASIGRVRITVEVYPA